MLGLKKNKIKFLRLLGISLEDKAGRSMTILLFSFLISTTSGLNSFLNLSKSRCKLSLDFGRCPIKAGDIISARNDLAGGKLIAYVVVQFWVIC